MSNVLETRWSDIADKLVALGPDFPSPFASSARTPSKLSRRAGRISLFPG